MGKSTAANDFRSLGIAVHDADASVHKVMAPKGPAYTEIANAFPEAMDQTGINRRKLGDLVFANKDALTRLEGILHPLVRQEKRRFLSLAARRHDKLVVLDVPLLFETQGEASCDFVCVVTAPDFVQRARVLRRAGMTEEKFNQIVKKQVPDAVKRRKADFIIRTGLGRLESRRTIRHIVDIVRCKKPRHWPLKRWALVRG